MRSSLRITLSGFIFPAFFAVAQNNGPISLVSRLPEGPCHAVFVKDMHAYVGNGSALDVVDVSDPSNPTRVGRAMLPGVAEEVIVDGSYVYIAGTRPGLTILEVSTSGAPVLVASVDLCDAWAIELADSLMFVAHSDLVTILDVSSPSSPQVVSAITLGGNDVWDVAVRGDTLFIAAPQAGIYVYDVHEPSQPAFIKQFFLNDGFKPRSLTWCGPYLYVTSSPPGMMEYGKMHILEIIGPDSLHEVSSVTFQGDWGSSGRNVFVNGSIAYGSYASDVGNGVYIIDISSAEAPKLIYNLGGNDPMSIFVAGSTLFLAGNEAGMKVYDVSVPTPPQLLATYYTSAKTLDIALSGSWAYVSSGGIKSVDLSHPQNPVVHGPFAFSAGPIETHGSYTFVKSYSCIDIFDASSGDTLTKIGSLCHVDVTGFEVYENLLYVMGRDGMLHIADILSSGLPSWLGSTKAGGTLYDVSVMGSHAYVALARSGVSIIDVSDPTVPILVSTFAIPGVALGIDTFEDRAYVALRDSGLAILDLSNPSSPSVISTIPISRYNSAVTVAFPFAYVATLTGVTVIDVSNAASPQIVDSVQTADLPRAVAVSGIYFYVADYRGGLFVFANDLLNSVQTPRPDVPSEFRLSQNFPNPFNSRTRITYDLPRAGDVVVTIHSLAGELLETVFKGHQASGTRSVEWEPSGLSSGVYFYSVEFNGNSVTRGCVLLK